LVLLALVPNAVGGVPQRQDWLSLACSMAEGGGHGDPPGVQVPGVGGDGTAPSGGGSSVEDRHTSAGTTDAGARGQRTVFQPLPMGLDSTGTRLPPSALSGRTHPEAAPSGAGTHFGGGQPPDVTTWGSESVPLPAREPAGGSSSCAPPGSRSTQGAPAREHNAPGPAVSVPRPSGPVGDPLQVRGRWGRCQNGHGSLWVGVLVVLPQALGVPGKARVSSGETPWPRSFGSKLPAR